MVWALRTRFYNSRTDETLFYHSTISIAPDVTGTWSLTELAGQRVAITLVDYATFPGGASPQGPAQKRKNIALTFPAGVPSIAASHPSGATQSAACDVIVFTVGGSAAAAGSYGFRAKNENGRFSVDSDRSAYGYIGRFVPSGSTVSFTCVGMPLVFFELDATNYRGIHKIEQTSANNWTVTVMGGAPIRVFGRVDLNWPNGSGSAWAARLRRRSDGKVTFDSGRRMLKLAAYTADSVVTANDSSSTITPPISGVGRSIAWNPYLIYWTYQSTAVGPSFTGTIRYHKLGWRTAGADLQASWVELFVGINPNAGGIQFGSGVLGGSLTAPIQFINNADFP